MKQKVDISIIYDCQKGNHDAFRQIYEAYQQQIYKLAFRYTHDSEESLDITQEIFMRIFLRIGNFRNECSFDTWVYRVSVNAIISAIRKNKDHILSDEDIIASMKSSINVDNNFHNLLLTAKVGDEEFEIWKSNKKDGKFEVINSSMMPKKATKNIHSRMTKEEIISEIISKVFDANK